MLETIGLSALNLALVVALAPLAEGIVRRLRAIVHSRQGPPLTQPYLDLAKLLIKEDLNPGSGLIWRLAPAVCLGAVLTAALLAPIGPRPPLGFAGDLFAFIYLAALGGVAIILAAFASGSSYACVGASREMMMMLSVEPVIAIALVTAAVKSGSMRFEEMATSYAAAGPSVSMVVAGVAFLLALQAHVGKLPFDIAEAEQEIMEGPFVERSGPGLALFKLASYSRVIVFGAVLTQIFVPWPRVGIWPVDLAINLLLVGIVVALVGLVSAVNPRLRIDQSMSFFSRIVVFVAIAGLVFASIGA